MAKSDPTVKPGTVPNFHLHASLWGLAAGFGLSLQDRYTRALRPFFDFSLFHNSLTGSGHSVRLGMAGSLAGSLQLKPSFVEDLNSPHHSRGEGPTL